MTPRPEAVDTLSTLLTEAINGSIELGFTHAMSLKSALATVVKSEAAVEVMAHTWSKFWNTNPTSSGCVEMAAGMNPALATFFQSMKMAAKTAETTKETT